jgi:hypothetical protein
MVGLKKIKEKGKVNILKTTFLFNFKLKMTNTLGNNSNRKKPIYDNSPADELKKRIMSVKQKKKKSKKTIESKVQSSGNLRFVTDKKEFEDYIKFAKDHLHEELFNIGLGEVKFVECGGPTYEKMMEGSNPFAAVLMDIYLKYINSNYRLATQANLEKNLEFVKGTNNYTGIIIENFKRPKIPGENTTFSKLIDGLKKEGFGEHSNPTWVELKGLSLDDKLNYVLTDEVKSYHNPILNKEGISKYNKVDEYGLPKIDNVDGKRNSIMNKSDCRIGFLNLDNDFGSSLKIRALDKKVQENSRIVLAKQK